VTVYSKLRSFLDAHPWLWAVGVGLLAFLLRLPGAGQIPVAGDELFTLVAAHPSPTLGGAQQDLGQELNGLFYHLLLKLWLLAGTGSLWARLPSIAIGALGASLMYFWLRSWRGDDLARWASVLFALSPFAVEYAREIRFYSPYLTSSILAFWSYTNWLVRPSRKNLILLVLACALLCGSGIMGLLAVVLLSLDYGIWHSPLSRRRRIMLAALLVFICIFVLFFRSFSTIGWRLFQRITGVVRGAKLAYIQPRGFSVVSFAKVGVLLFSFSAGQFVYPLQLSVTLPIALLVALVVVMGLRQLASMPQQTLIRLMTFTVLTILCAFFVLDSLLPPSYRASATAKYVIFLLPLFIWVMAEGCTHVGNLRSVPHPLRALFLIGVLGTQVAGLAFLYQHGWAMSGYKAINWHRAISLAQGFPQLLAEGSAEGVLRYYLSQSDGKPQIGGAWAAARAIAEGRSDAEAQIIGRMAVVNANGKDDTHCDLEPLLRKLSSSHRLTSAFVDWPLFVYGYEPRSSSMVLTGEAQTVDLPRSLYGIRFQDLRLPQTFSWQGRDLPVTGAWRLPDCAGAREVSVIPQAMEQAPASVLLVSNVIDMSALPQGSAVGELLLATTSGEVRWLVRLSRESASWDGRCSDGTCQPVVSWHKRIALVGQTRYPGAYRDFTAHLFATEIELPQGAQVNKITARILADQGSWYIWSIYLLPAKR